jgi:hypothetical protein
MRVSVNAASVLNSLSMHADERKQKMLLEGGVVGAAVELMKMGEVTSRLLLVSAQQQQNARGGYGGGFGGGGGGGGKLLFSRESDSAAGREFDAEHKALRLAASYHGVCMLANLTLSHAKPVTPFMHLKSLQDAVGGWFDIGGAGGGGGGGTSGASGAGRQQQQQQQQQQTLWTSVAQEILTRGGSQRLVSLLSSRDVVLVLQASRALFHMTAQGGAGCMAVGIVPQMELQRSSSSQHSVGVFPSLPLAEHSCFLDEDQYCNGSSRSSSVGSTDGSATTAASVAAAAAAASAANRRTVVFQQVLCPCPSFYVVAVAVVRIASHENVHSVLVITYAPSTPRQPPTSRLSRARWFRCCSQ